MASSVVYIVQSCKCEVAEGDVKEYDTHIISCHSNRDAANLAARLHVARQDDSIAVERESVPQENERDDFERFEREYDENNLVIYMEYVPSPKIPESEDPYVIKVRTT